MTGYANISEEITGEETISTHLSVTGEVERKEANRVDNIQQNH